MIFRVSDARTFLKPFIDGGTCDNDVIDSRINECTRRLLDKADWKNTRRFMRILTANKTFALPREVDKILMADVCGSPVHVFSSTYEFVDGGPGDLSMSGIGLTKHLIDMGDGWPTAFDIPSTLTVDDSADSTDDIVVGDGYYLMAFSDDLEDRTLALTVNGMNERMMDIRTAAAPGQQFTLNIWNDETEGSIIGPLSELNMSASRYRDIRSIFKPVTKGYVTLYAVEPSTNAMFLLGKYHPSETAPSFRRYRITNTGVPDHANVYCLVKLKYVPIEHENDVLLIQNLDALKLMCVAIREENAGNIANALQYESNAVRLLSEQLANEQNTGTPVIMNVEYDLLLNNRPSIYAR